MSEPAGLLLSVWGEARRMVPPGSAQSVATLGAVLAAREAVTVHEVTWHVDWDNPAWPGVRAAAVQAAIAKGRDYAAALGGSLRGVKVMLRDQRETAPVAGGPVRQHQNRSIWPLAPD